MEPPQQSQATPRDYLAAERTFLAWVRTRLALMGLGFVLARFGIFLRQRLVRLMRAGSTSFNRPSRLAVTVAAILAVRYSVWRWVTISFPLAT